MYFQIFRRENSCKGSAMVEAAIFFPIAVFCAMAVMALMLNMYSQAATQAHLHVYLRAQASAYGGRTQARLTDAYERDRYRREAESMIFSVNEDDKLLRKSLKASYSKLYYGGMFTNPEGYETEYYARGYIIHEAAFARGKDAVLGDAADLSLDMSLGLDLGASPGIGLDTSSGAAPETSPGVTGGGGARW